ncbi:MAG: zinc ribbon domain-containing protein [Desulfobacter sp.]|nr:zinc ribbon domain-containing protein [Desulfobacter sp.]
MPIFEFKCTECEEFFEVLVMGSGDDKEIKCPKCKSQEFQRVVSATNYAIGDSGPGAGSKGVHTQERTCSSGTCKTYTVPGATKG